MNSILFAARLFFIISTLFTGTVLKAQTFSLVKEINTTATTNSIGTTLIQRVGTTVYFVANDGTSGNELWKSDGTNAGTEMVKDITPGAAGTLFSLMSEGNGLLFFVANDGVNGSELWRSDGTSAGTYLLKDIRSGSASSDIIRLFFHNGFMFFGADDGINGSELWKSDGTTTGTVLIKDINPGVSASSPAPNSNPIYTFIALGNEVYFAANDFSAVNGIGRELWKTDGTAAGTIPVKDIFSGGAAIGVTNHKTAIFNNKLYFSATSGTDGIELWATDGTDAGTYRVKDIVAGGGSSQPNNLIAFNGALYFTASSTNNAIPDLYKTDGTEAGTVMVRNLVADGISLSIGNSATIDFFTVANGKLFFRGNGPNGLELYASDGTTAGTGIVKDIYPGVNGVNLNSLFAYDNNVYFLGTDVELPSRSGLYKSDGTAAGTVQLTDAASGGALGMSSATMTSAGGKLFFWGNTNDNGIELWSTDGTNANTALVKDINTIKLGTPNSGANFFGTLVYNGFYYYAAVDDTHGNELWKSDGTEAGTVLVKDIWPGKAPSNPAQFFVYNGAIYFTASNGLSGTELWKTDGTESGTILVTDINPGPVNSGPNRFFISNNYLYFTAYHPSYGIELWRSDGTAAGTTLFIDLVTGAATGTFGISDVISIGNNAYAIMNLVAGNVLGIPTGNRLIKIDGVTNTISDFASVVTTGTDLGVVGNTLYVTGRNSSNQTLLWKSENGGALSQVKVLSTTATNAYQLTNCGGKLYFNASNGTANGSEPWVSDGTDAGTFMLKDINTGANPSTPFQFVFSGGKVFFTASSTSTNSSEYELWATDGTTAGTYLVKDILPGSTGSRPNATISAFGNKVLFSANNGTNGYELWQSDGTATGTFQLQEFNTNGDGIPLTGVAFNFPTDYVYSKLGEKIVFFARSADKGLQLYSGSIASPYKYVNDNSTANDVYTTAVGDNANNGSQSAPYATLSHALSQASEGDTIYVDAGSYAEQVIINKGITIIGAGQTLSFFTPPATALVPAQGPFTEIGLFETTQGIGDVHIQNLSINSNGNSQNIIIQGGGSVKNCTLLNGQQGIFFRVDPAIKTALIENNIIEAGIGINCQGSGLTATIRNNTISRATSYYAGIFAGLDFGPLLQLTIQNNIINNFFGEGILAASFNGTYTLNSITGTGTNAINRNGNGGNTPTATCNWFGTSNAASIATKIIGTVIYTPFLTDGTDNSSNPGFQPVGTCGSGNSYYVNDVNTTGDVFTSAVGNDANAGTAAAPFASIQYAVNIAAANDIIYVDAGTYTEQVTITKGITIIGAGQNLTSILKPATTVAPPGPFPEQAVIQTAQNIGDVNIKDLSVTGDFTVGVTPMIIQSAGSVRNCKLQGGNQGLFVRIDAATNPGAKTFYIEGNTIQAEYIAVNTVGTSLHAILSNNTIAAFNAGFSSGMWAGMDFGPLGRLTATNNLFSTYSSSGIQISASNASITQNAFTGTGAQAINRTGGANITANCNWYGTANASAIVPKITAGVNYYPWYVDGTDASPVAGFQHYSESCGGGLNFLYVNDNNTTGDLFTTTTGDDANTGTPTSPLATFGAALTKASPGAVIYMDAGTYTAQDATIDKQVQVIGTNFNVSPNSAADPLLLNSTRNAETIIENTNWIIGANSIYFDGLTFNSLGKQAITLNNTTWSDTRLLRNRLRISSNLTQLNFTGSGTSTMALSAIANWNLNIRENRFEKEDAAFGTTLVVSRYGGVNINNNSFVVTGTTVRTQTAIFAGSGGVVNYMNIANNTFDRASTAINSSRLAIANMNFNKIINTSNAFFGFNPLIESSEVGFRYNTLDGSAGIFPFIQYTRQGGNAVGATSSFTAEENTITGTAVAGTTTLLGSMNLIFFNSVLNPSLTVRNNKMTYAGDLSTVAAHFIRPIMIRGNLANTIVEKNEINLTGINQQQRTIGVDLPVSPAITLYTDNTTTSFLQSGSVINIFNNKINGFKHSFAAYDAASAGNDAYVGYGNIPAGVTVNINNNSFTGDSISINNGTVGQPVLATCNWYGSADAAVVVPKISGIATYSPWLTNGTDNDVATGFQPLANVCNGRQNKFYVNDGDITGDVFTTKIGDDANSGIPSAPLLTINAAITKASAGDTVYVDAGNYITPNIAINKAVTILGTNYLINPNDETNPLLPNAARNSEAIISGSTLTIGANNINIEGLTLDPGNKSQVVLSSASFSNFNFKKNKLIIGTGTLISLVGPSTTDAELLTASDYLFADNRFEKLAVGNGITLSLAYIKNFSIHNNAFVITGPASRNQIPIIVGNGFASVVDNLSVTNNVIDRHNYNLFSFSIVRMTITGNKFYNARSGLFIQANYPGSTDIRIEDNLIEHNLPGVPVLDIMPCRIFGSTSGNSNISIRNNTINIDGTGLTSLPPAISPLFAATVANPSLVVSGNRISHTGSYNLFPQGVTGIGLVGKNFNSTVENNEVVFNGQNIIASFVHSGISTGTDGVNGMPASSVLNFRNNKVSGYKQSITFYDGTASAADPYVGYGNLPIGATVNINNNSFSGDSISINNGSVGQPVLATCNWYGSASAQNFINKLTLPTVDIVPWLTNGTDNDAATGFQPVPNSCDGYPTLITLDNYTNVTCNGANNGSINITTSYGKAPFTYTWTKEGDEAFVSHDEDPTGLAPGTYHLAIVDGNGSNIYIIDPEADGPGTITVTITEPSILTASSSGGNVSCFGGNNGSASVTAGGGTAPYTYLWSNNETTNEITNLIAGTYIVTVTDDNGCTATASYEVTQPTLLTASISNNSTACSNNATVTAGGGTAPYTYLWSNGSTSSSITGVIAGIYSVTVTDSNGCTATASVTLIVSGAFNPTASATDVTCFGANNGIITVTNANGTAPFTFSIDGVNFLPGAFPYSFTNLAPGTYTVAAKDVNGCTGFVTRTVLQPAQLVVTLTTVQSTCFGLSTGSVSVNASGGTGALSYSWTGDGGFTSSQKNISGLATGNYSLTVTDKNGCTAILNVFVPSLTQITVNSTVNNIACKGELNGSIILNVTGGTGNFTYLWNTGATTSSITNLGTGNYNVTVTDIGSGCVASKSFTITQPSNVVALSTSKTNATGCASLGTITATGSGGTSPYQYSLDGINYQPSGSFTGLYAGSYIVRVKDFNGCIKTSAAISITDNGLDEYDGSGSNRNNTKSKAAPISTGVTIAGRIATTGDPEDWYKFTITIAGNYILSLTHPSASFTYNLFTLNNATAIGTVGSTSTSKTYSLTAGDYYIQVTGGLSYVCYSLNVSSSVAARNSTTTGTVNKPPVVIATAILKARTYPNPHSGSFMLNIESPEDGTARVELFTITGQKLVERTVILQKGENNLVPFKGISKGTVLYRVQIGKHVATGKVIGIE